jgi:hypothetical protein
MWTEYLLNGDMEMGEFAKGKKTEPWRSTGKYGTI